VSERERVREKERERERERKKERKGGMVFAWERDCCDKADETLR
jgi:hypothetical protein